MGNLLKIKKQKVRKKLSLKLFLSHLFAKLEDWQSNWDDEWEERELKCVPGFDSKDSKSKWDECHGFQENEY